MFCNLKYLFRRSLSLTVFLCLICAWAPAFAAVADDLQFAAALFNDGEYRQALDEFSRLKPALAGAEWEDDVDFWMAECHFHLQEYDRAIDLYRKIVTTYPGFSQLEEAYVKLMGAHYSAGRFQSVMETAEAFSKQFPASASNDQVYLLWIQSALRIKQFTRAEELLDIYQKRSPGSPYVWSLKSILANFYLKDQKFDRALPFFEELYNYQKDPNFLLWVGECRFQTSAWSGAGEAFAQFLSEQPQNDVARFKLGLSQYRMGRHAEALQTLGPLGEKESVYTEDALYFIAQALLQTGNPEEAKKHLAGILKLSPSAELRSRAVTQIMNLETEGGRADIDKMIQAYEKHSASGAVPPMDLQQYRVYSAYQKQDFRTVVSLLTDPKDRRQILMLAESLYALGQYDEASRMYSKLLSSSATQAEKRPALAGIAWCAYALEQHEEAIKLFETYVSLDPSAPADAYLAMAQCALTLGQADRAIVFYERARKSSPEPKKILRNIGVLHFNSGNYQRAVDALEGIAEDDQLLSIVGRGYLYLKQPNKAMTFFRRLKHPERYALEIGAVHYELGQLEEAKTYFEKANQSPGTAAGLNLDEFLGIIAYNQGNAVEAATRLRKAQEKDPGSVEIRFELAASLMRVDNAPQQELIELLRSLVADPRTPRSYKDRARAWLSRKSVSSDVRKELEDISGIEAPADRAVALEAKATHFFSKQEYDTALIFYEKLLASANLPADMRAQGLYGMGWSLQKLGRKPRAQDIFKELLAEYPKSSYAAEVVLHLVEEAYGAGRYAEAADLALKHVNKISKNAARLRFMAAESLFETGRYAEALNHYKAFLPDADNLADYVRYRSGLTSYHLRQFTVAVELFSAISDSALLERKYYYLGMSNYSLGRKKSAAEHFENVLDIGRGDFQEEAWKNMVVLMEELMLWKKAVAYGGRLSESPNEVDRFVYAKALSNTASPLAGRYAEKLGYIAKDPEIASEALLLAAMAYRSSDLPKTKQLCEKIMAKYPKSRAASEAKKLLGGFQ